MVVRQTAERVYNEAHAKVEGSAGKWKPGSQKVGQRKNERNHEEDKNRDPNIASVSKILSSTRDTRGLVRWYDSDVGP